MLAQLEGLADGEALGLAEAEALGLAEAEAPGVGVGVVVGRQV